MQAPSQIIQRQRPSPEEAKAIQSQRENLSKADTLLKQPEFQWFLAECLDVKIAEQAATALASTSTVEQRTTAVYVREALASVRSWVQERRDTARDTIRSVES